MLTPRFTCSQDDEFLYINIHVSHIRFDSGGVQMIVEGELFIFTLSPYYLRLRFSNQLIDDEEHPGNAQYESKEELIKIKLFKLNKGEVFQDLDLPAKLLARLGENTSNEIEPLDTKQLLQEIGIQTADESLLKELGQDLQKDEPKNKPLIQVVEESNTSDLQETLKEGEAFDWEINQTIETDNILKTKYGFNDQYDSIIGVSISNGNDINEIDDPEHTTPSERIKKRLLKENSKFDPEYYAADYMTGKYSQDDEYSEIKDLLKWESPLLKRPVNAEFTAEENEKMLNLPKKSQLVSNPKPLYYLIVSLLFSYSFELRETEGELNTESAWTIGKLTPQLSSLDSNIIPEDATVPILKAIIITSIRRSLAYPLHRNFELSYKAWLDSVKILRQGRNYVLKALLALHEPFRYHDVYYVYNKIWIDDLISWLIHDSKDQDFILKALGDELYKNLLTLEKNDIVFETLDEQGDVDTVLNISEVEQIAEEMYLSQQQ